MSSSDSSTTDLRLQYLPVEQIEANPFQPRQVFDDAELEALAKSLAAHGVLQSVLVRPFGDGYQLVAGERRWRAAKLAKFKTLPCIVRDVSDTDMILLGREENEHRIQITDRDRALQLKRIWEDWEAQGKTPSYRSIAAFLKVDKSWVSARFKSLDFYEDVIGMLERNENVLTVAKEINDIPQADRRARYIRVIDAGGSRNDVLELIRQDKQQDEEHAATVRARLEGSRAPDHFTQQQQRAYEQTGNGITLGRAMTPQLSSNRDDAKQQIPVYVERIQTWAPHVSKEELKRLLGPLLALVEE